MAGAKPYRTAYAASGGATIASFQYDAFGRRIQNSAGNQVLYDGANAVQELSDSTPVANRLTGGIDEFLSRTDLAGTVFPLADALGSTIALTDTTGAVQTQYTYQPFGSTPPSDAANSNWFQYTGRENDGTGLYYYRARYYSLLYQRFISEDPISFAGGINIYAYVGNDPVGLYDPFGLKPRSWWHWPWHSPFGGSNGSGGNGRGNKRPNDNQPNHDPSKDFRPHASEKDCQAFEDVEKVADALDLADTTGDVAAVFNGEEISESSGPGLPSQLAPIHNVLSNCT